VPTSEIAKMLIKSGQHAYRQLPDLPDNFGVTDIIRSLIVGPQQAIRDRESLNELDQSARQRRWTPPNKQAESVDFMREEAGRMNMDVNPRTEPGPVRTHDRNSLLRKQVEMYDANMEEFGHPGSRFNVIAQRSKNNR